MSEFRVNSITNQDGSAGPQVCGVSTFSGKSGVQIPSGSSDFRRQDGGGRGRGLFAGGESPRLNVIDKIEIATTGNATDFGDLLAGNGYLNGASSQTRSLMLGGTTPSAINVIQFVTISTTGDAVNFGDLATARARGAVFSDSNGGLAQ